MHVVQRGVNRCAIFLDDEDRHHYHHLLRQACERFGTKQKGTEVITVSRKSYGLLRQCLIACAVCDEQAWIFLIVG